MSTAPILSKNLIVKALVNAMLALTALTVTPWRSVAVWLVAMAIATGAEEWSARRISPEKRGSPDAIAPVARVLISGLYALAAWQLVVHNGPGTRLVAFSAITASMVYVLMGYWRSLPVFLASIAPYFLVLGLVGFRTARDLWGHGQPLAILCTAFPTAIFAILL